MKMLIVDDDPTTRELLGTILQPYGECQMAADGVEALKAFNTPQQGPYDLILLDILMPRMGGQEVLKKIRQIEAARGIIGFEGVKIIIITAVDDLDNIREAYDSCCKSYLVKPITQEKLLDELKKLKLIPA